jgi:hypothetical protein
MICLDYYFQQKCVFYFLHISDSCEVLIPPETTHNLCEHFAVWQELACTFQIWQYLAMPLGYYPKLYALKKLNGIKYDLFFN